MNKKLVKILISLMLVLVAVLSFFIISRISSVSNLNESLIKSIDEKILNVNKFTTASAISSVVISAIPGDMATPIAEKLADITGYFLVVLSVLYTEKALLTFLGVATFKILIPIICAIGIISLWFWNSRKSVVVRLIKIIIFTFAVAIAIPLSLIISDVIYTGYSDRINEVFSSSQELSDEIAPLTEAGNDEFIVSSLLEKISETVSSLYDKASRLLKYNIELAAITIVTNCIVPCLGFVFILWRIKNLFSVDVFERAKALIKKNPPDKKTHPDNN